MFGFCFVVFCLVLFGSVWFRLVCSVVFICFGFVWFGFVFVLYVFGRILLSNVHWTSNTNRWLPCLLRFLFDLADLVRCWNFFEEVKYVCLGYERRVVWVFLSACHKIKTKS